jgi:GNAT superfamily N-acetyltransferase
VVRIVSAREHLDHYSFRNYDGAAMVTAHDGRHTIGYLTWWEPHTVIAAVDNPRPSAFELQRVEVRPEYHRRGIASKLYAFARTIEPNLHFSRHMTPAGQRWAASLGYQPETIYPVADLGGEGLWNH